jgi:trigger factor
MQFDLQIEEVSQSQRLLKFSVNKKEIVSALDMAYKRLSKQVRMQGYPRGKTPRWLLEKRYAKSIEAEVVEEVIQKSFDSAEIPHVVLGRPSVTDIGKIKSGKALDFSMRIDIRPEVEIVGYQGMEVPYEEPTLQDGELEQSIAKKLESKKKIEDAPEGKSAAEGDFVLAKFTLTSDGEQIADESGTMINIGSERFYPGLDEKLIGLQKGQTSSVECTIAEDAILENLQGKECTAEVEIINIQSYHVPELNDELAKELGFEGGVEEMRVASEDELLQARKEGARNAARVSILQALSKSNEFEVPQPIIEEQLKALTEELRMRRMYAGEDPRKVQFSDAEMADLRERAEFAGKSACILSSISKQESIEVESADIQAKVEEIASMRGQTVESIMSYIRAENAEGMLAERILEEKTLNWIFEQAALVAPTVESAEEAAEEEAPEEAPEEAQVDGEETAEE